MSRQIVAAMADLHCGHRLGLLSPHTTLYDEDEHGDLEPYQPEPTAIEKWLWRWYKKDRQSVLTFADGDDIILLVVGDLTWGHKYKRGVLTTRAADQIIMATDVLEPWLSDVKTMRIVQGTQNHEFYEGTSGALVMGQLQARDPDVDISLLSHGLSIVEGLRIDYTHHGPSPGIRQWTKGRQLRYYTQSVVETDIHNDVAPPDILIRAHYHEFGWESLHIIGKRIWSTEAFILPAYCGLTGYGRQATRSTYLLNCGLVAIEIIDGEIGRIEPFWRRVDLRREEEL